MFLAGSKLNLKLIVCQKIQPANHHPLGLLHCFEPAQCLMIRAKDERTMKQVVAPLLEEVDYG